MAYDHTNDGTYGFLHGAQWDKSVLAYWFPQSISQFDQSASNYGIGELSKSFSGLGSDAQDYFKYIFEMLSSICGLTFIERSDAEIQAGYTHATNAAHAYLPDNTSSSEAGDVWFNESTYFSDFQSGQFSGFVVMHELGHALGLVHPHEISGLSSEMDQMSYSVMSYKSTIGSSSGYTNDIGDYAQSLMSLDILALQARYGINYDHQSDDTTYTFNSNTGAMSINGIAQKDGAGDTIFRTIWDGEGADLIDLSNFNDNMEIDLDSGGYLKFSNDQLAELTQDGETAIANVFLAVDPDGSGKSLIENIITGDGDDVVAGNSAANHISSGAGNDILYGQKGDDILLGESGNDILRGGHGDDVLLGGTGDNILVGGTGSDSFVFHDNQRCNTIIRDFDAEIDTLILEDSMDIANAEFGYDDGNCIIAIGDSKITILNGDDIDIDSFTLIANEEISLLIS